MAKTAYLDLFSGIAGDMFLGALLDAGCSQQDLLAGLRELPISGEFDFRAARVRRGALMGTKVDVEVLDSGAHGSRREVHGSTEGSKENSPHEHYHDHGRSYSSIARMIQESGLPDRVKEDARAVFLLIGEVEARLHGSTLEEIHFHEVGAVDSMVDIVGVCLALRLLEIESVYSSAVTDGFGTLEAAHGVMPVPAPATLELLKGVPIQSCDVPLELVTPTGAALLRHFCKGYGPRPPMVVEAIGYGAGSRDFPQRANLLRVSIGELTELPGSRREARGTRHKDRESGHPRHERNREHGHEHVHHHHHPEEHPHAG